MENHIKLIIILIIISVLCSLVYATLGTIPSFNEQTNPFNITYNLSDFETFSLNLFRYSNVLNITLKLKGVQKSLLDQNATLSSFLNSSDEGNITVDNSITTLNLSLPYWSHILSSKADFGYVNSTPSFIDLNISTNGNLIYENSTFNETVRELNLNTTHLQRCVLDTEVIDEENRTQYLNASHTSGDTGMFHAGGQRFYAQSFTGVGQVVNTLQMHLHGNSYPLDVAIRISDNLSTTNYLRERNITLTFTGNYNVFFGDINLSEQTYYIIFENYNRSVNPAFWQNTNYDPFPDNFFYFTESTEFEVAPDINDLAFNLSFTESILCPINFSSSTFGIINYSNLEVNYTRLDFPYNPSLSGMEQNIWNHTREFLDVEENISLDVNKINDILEKNCDGGTIDGDNCIIDFNFHSDSAGILEVDIINSTYEFGIDNCSQFTNPIINLTYKSAIDNLLISVDNAYDLTVISPFSQTLQGTFTNQENSSFCSPVNYSFFNYSLTGDLTLSKSEFGTQIYEYSTINPLIGSFNALLYDLFLSELDNTSTIVFTWRTNTFETVDGIMEIYRCEGDGTRNLISSSSIINGESSANLEFLLTSYSYEVISGGVRFTDTDTFTKCHIETQATRLYILKVGTPTAPITGLYSIPCNITRTGNFSFLMNWGTNPENDDIITGCTKAIRQTVRGDTQIFEECSNTTGIGATVADSGFTYIVKGRLFQSGFSIGCQNELTFETSSDQADTFGLTGILSIFFLVAGAVLLFANEKPKWYPIMGVFGIVFAWILGILAFGWIAISSLVAFVAIIVSIGRHGRKQ